MRRLLAAAAVSLVAITVVLLVLHVDSARAQGTMKNGTLTVPISKSDGTPAGTATFKEAKDGKDLEARGGMMKAAMMGAVAFQKGLGAIHSVSHPVGARYDTHHGMTNGVMFPYVMLANRDVITARMPLVARILDLPKADFDGVLDWILGLRKALKVPHTLAEMGVKESDAKSIAADAVKDPTAGSNPRKLSEADFEELTLAAIRGDLGNRA